MLTVGIDIGTSFSSIAFLNEKTGEAELVKVESGYGDKYSMPSAVFVEENGNVLTGQAALSTKMRNPACFKAEFKRDLGQEVPYMLGNCQMLPEELYKEVFIYFKKCAEESTGQKIGKAYITYPANYNKRKKELIETAAKKAGLLDVEIIDEPSAAAFSYISKEKIREGDTLLIYDFGGGTFDTALMQYSNGVFKPLTEAMGLERCGGIDIDNLVFEDILSQIPSDKLHAAMGNESYQKRFYAQVMDISIRIKHQLSSQDTVKDVIPVGFDTCDYTLDRQRFNGMIHALVEETMDRVRNIIHHAGIKAGDITHVVVVGGSSRIPYVRERLQQMTGREISKDIDADLAICKGAAVMQTEREKHNCEEQFKLGSAHYDSGEYGMAFECFKRAAEAGHAGAQLQLGTLYGRGDGVRKDEEAALYWVRKAAEQGFTDAQCIMGNFYNHGYGVEKDAKQAVYWFQKAAEQGDAVAQNNMGLFYDNGYGVEQDHEKAVNCYQKAADQGEPSAQFNLGEHYENGLGIGADKTKAVYWYQKAADQDDADALRVLGIFYTTGEGVPQDSIRAAALFKKAAELGDAEAQNFLGFLYSIGRGVSKDPKQAAYWLQKSAEQGNATGQTLLAECYVTGQGVAEDFKQGVYWYQKAADQGDADAQNNLGHLYFNGLGVNCDPNMAGIWWSKAAAQGSEEAMENLKRLKKNSSGRYVNA